MNDYDATRRPMPMLFQDALAQVVATARAKLPESLHGRLDNAVGLIEHHAVEVPLNGAPALVHSRTRPGITHTVNGACSCEDAHFQAPDGLCSHRIAVALSRKAAEVLRTHPAAPEGLHLDLDAEVLAPAPIVGIDPKYVVTIQGKPFVQVAGLLALAHARGLQSLTTTFTYNDGELAIAQSTAVFPFGSFTDVGDASPTNVNRKVAPHFRRVAATRATARALRLGLNVDMCSLVELEEHDG